MRGESIPRHAAGLTALALACAVCLHAAEGSPDPSRSRVRLYRRVQARIAAARSLHVKIHDELAHQDVECWFQKPNRYKIVSSDRSRTYCDGRHLIHVSATGERTSKPAPSTFPEDERLVDFYGFLESEPRILELRDLNDFEFGGVKRRAYWVKTTESGIEFGQEFLNPTTMLPIGHHTTLRDEEEKNLYYPLVELNPRLRIADFRPTPRRR